MKEDELGIDQLLKELRELGLSVRELSYYELVANLTGITKTSNIECVIDQQSPTQCNVLYKSTHWGSPSYTCQSTKRKSKREVHLL